jgi:uncharacterized membrane protein YcaP (DUF421 family)
MEKFFSIFFISGNSLLKIVLLAIFSELALFILTKLMGNRQVSQLSMFDYIIGITIGSIAAEMATSLENNYMEPLIAMIIYALVAIIISYVCQKSIKIRRFIDGNSLILLDNGELYMRNFKTSKLDLNEFLMQCRVNGFFNINEIQTAILEPNGQISFLPKASKKPATVENLNLVPDITTITTNVILDGTVLYENLRHTGNDITWLNNELKNQKIKDVSSVFLAFCDSKNNLSVYTKKDIQNTHNSFD